MPAAGASSMRRTGPCSTGCFQPFSGPCPPALLSGHRRTPDGCPQPPTPSPHQQHRHRQQHRQPRPCLTAAAAPCSRATVSTCGLAPRSRRNVAGGGSSASSARGLPAAAALPELLAALAESPSRDYYSLLFAAVGAIVWVKVFDLLAAKGVLEKVGWVHVFERCAGVLMGEGGL